MNALFAPSATLTLGSQQWTNQLLRIDVSLDRAPGVNLLRAHLPAASPFSAALGDPVELTLNNGETEGSAFTGVIDAIRRHPSRIEITALDAGGVLARFRPAATFENVTPGTLIRQLASEAGVDTGSLENGSEMSFYVADPSRTAWEHVARVCGWLGALATVSADNKIQSKVVEITQADLALRYGREILDVAATQHAAPIESFTVTGEGGAASASSPDARRPTTDFFQGDRPDGPGRTALWQWQPALRTAAAASTAGKSLERAYSSSRDAGTLTTILEPLLRPGTVMEMQDAPTGLPGGPVWIRRVRHTVADGRALTVSWFSGGGGVASSLLGSAASAIGGLL